LDGLLVHPAGRNEGTVIKKKSQGGPIVRLTPCEVEGALLFALLREIKKQTASPEMTTLPQEIFDITQIQAALARKICDDLLNQMLTKFEFEAVEEGDAALDKVIAHCLKHTNDLCFLTPTS
jgi:hypothetical protein